MLPTILTILQLLVLQTLRLCKRFSNIKSSVQGLGCPTGLRKTIEGPATELTIPGLNINTTKQILSLPSDKLTHLLGALDQWIQ